MTTGSRTRNYVVSLASGYALTAFTVLVGLWLTPYTLRFLDREQYAIFSLASDVLMWLGLLDLGITAGLRVHAAKLMGRPDQERLNRLASTAFFAQLVVVGCILAAGAVLGAGLPHFFDVRPDLQHEAGVLMVLMCVATAMSMGTQAFSGILIASQQQHVDNYIGILLLVIRTVLTVVLLHAGWGVLSLAVAQLAAKATASVLAIARVYKFLPGLTIRLRLASWDVFKDLWHVSIWFSLGGLAGVFNSGLDRIVTAKVLNLGLVTTLSLTGRLYYLATDLVGRITDAARPMLGQLFGEEKKQAALHTYRNLFVLSTGVGMVIALSIFAGNATFVSTWVGRINYGGWLLDLAFVAAMLRSLWGLPNRAVLSSNLQVRPQTLVGLGEGLLNLALSVWFAKMWGVVGVILGTVAAGLLTSMWLLPLLTARMFGESFKTLVLPDMAIAAKLLLATAPVALLGRFAAVSVGGYVGAILGMLTTVVGGSACLWFLALDDALRDRISRLLGQGILAMKTKVARYSS